MSFLIVHSFTSLLIPLFCLNKKGIKLNDSKTSKHFNNDTSQIQGSDGIQPRETPCESLKLRTPVTSEHTSPNLGEYHFLVTRRMVRKRHNPRKILCPTQNPVKILCKKIGKLIDNKICRGSSYKL